MPLASLSLLLTTFLPSLIARLRIPRGNATDLSLLPSLSSADIEKLQSVGKAAQAEKGRKYLLTNHGTDVWDHVSQLKGAKVDFVLDNG